MEPNRQANPADDEIRKTFRGPGGFNLSPPHRQARFARLRLKGRNAILAAETVAELEVMDFLQADVEEKKWAFHEVIALLGTSNPHMVVNTVHSRFPMDEKGEFQWTEIAQAVQARVDSMRPSEGRSAST